MKRLALYVIATAWTLSAAGSVVLANEHDEEPASGAPLFSKLFSSGDKSKVVEGEQTRQDARDAPPPYTGPKARIVVARFTDETKHRRLPDHVKAGLKEQLGIALVNSNRFIVLERDSLDAIRREQRLASQGIVRKSTAARPGQFLGAQLIAVASIKEFQRASGGQGDSRGTGGGILGQIGQAFGALGSGISKARVTMNLRLIDASTAGIIAATSIQGSSTEWSLNDSLAGHAKTVAWSGALAEFENKPIGKALRVAIERAVAFVAERTPQNYFRVNGAAPGTTAGPKPLAPAPQSTLQAKAMSTAPSLEGQVVRVKSRILNVRGGSGVGHPVLFVAKQNDPFLVTKQVGRWIQVQDEAGRVGWVASWLTAPEGTASASRATAAAATPSPVAKIIPGRKPDGAGKPTAGSVMAESPTADAKGGAAPNPYMARLKILKAAFDNKLITEEEYAKSRQQILERMLNLK